MCHLLISAPEHFPLAMIKLCADNLAAIFEDMTSLSGLGASISVLFGREKWRPKSTLSGSSFVAHSQGILTSRGL